MDIRIRKLRNGEKVEPLSRSFPTSGKPSCFQQCLNTSTDSLASDRCRSPKLGQYRKLPTHSECDVCHVLDRDAVNLKCFHTFCPQCLERHKISKNGCPVCVCPVTDSDLFTSTERLYLPSDELFCVDFDTEHNKEESVDQLVDTLELEVLSNLGNRQTAIQKEIERLQADVEKEISKIHVYVQNLKDMIDKRAEILIKNTRDSKHRHTAELARQKKVIGDFINRIKECINQYRDTTSGMYNSDDESAKTVENSIRSLFKLSDQVTVENVHIKCTTKNLSDNTLDFMGKVGVRVFLAQPLGSDLCRTFQFPSAVHSICPVNGRQAWIGYQNFIQLCSKSGHRNPPIDVGEDVHDITSDRKGNILIACHSSVKCLDASNQLRTLFSCKKTPQGIAIIENGSIVTCLGNEVVTYSTEGEVISRFGSSKFGELRMPYKVAVNSNGDVCVSDYQSSAGEVVVFDSGGRVKAKLRTEGMAPRGVAYNLQGVIYVADFRADRINLYSSQGHFLHTLLSSSTDGLCGPLSVAIDDHGNLWIGDWKRKVRIYKQTVCGENNNTD